jgi:hypothetical protein
VSRVSLDVALLMTLGMSKEAATCVVDEINDLRERERELKHVLKTIVVASRENNVREMAKAALTKP